MRKESLREGSEESYSMFFPDKILAEASLERGVVSSSITASRAAHSTPSSGVGSSSMFFPEKTPGQTPAPTSKSSG